MTLKIIPKKKLSSFPIRKTRTFFQKFQLARESLERLSTQENTIQPWAQAYLQIFKKRKGEITLISKSEEYCYVPKKLDYAMNYIIKRDQTLKETYWPCPVRESVPSIK